MFNLINCPGISSATTLASLVLVFPELMPSSSLLFPVRRNPVVDHHLRWIVFLLTSSVDCLPVFRVTVFLQHLCVLTKELFKVYIRYPKIILFERHINKVLFFFGETGSFIFSIMVVLFKPRDTRVVCFSVFAMRCTFFLVCQFA